MGFHEFPTRVLPGRKEGAVMVLPPQARRLRADQAEFPTHPPLNPFFGAGHRESADGYSEATSVVNAHVAGAAARGRPTPAVRVFALGVDVVTFPSTFA